MTAASAEVAINPAGPTPRRGGTTDVRRLWPGGPLRRWSAIRSSGCQIPLATGGFGGSYVCEGCREPVAGVYGVIRGVQRRQSWLCGSCKVQPAGVSAQNRRISAAMSAKRGIIIDEWDLQRDIHNETPNEVKA